MEIRIRATGAVMFESELRAYLLANDGPSYDVLTPEVMEAIGVDPVLEGPQATGGAFWQHSMRDGVELRDGRWYTKYVLGPVFPATAEGVAQRATYIANKKAEIVATKIAAVKAERDRRIQTGGYKVGAHWFHSDTFSRTQQMGLVMLGESMPADIQWKTLSGSFVTMTPALAGQIFAAAAASDVATFAAAEAHIAAVSAAQDPAAYSFSAGWPVVFGESA